MIRQTNMERRSLEIMRQCPRFERYSVPLCPLDAHQDSRAKLRGEPTCTLPKSVRHRIGGEAGLPLEGLTRREWAARQRCRGLSENQRQAQIAKLRPFRRVVHVSLSQMTSVSDRRCSASALGHPTGRKVATGRRGSGRE